MLIKEIVIVQQIFMALPVPEPPAHPSTGQTPATARPATGKDAVQRSAAQHGQDLDQRQLGLKLPPGWGPSAPRKPALHCYPSLTLKKIMNTR